MAQQPIAGRVRSLVFPGFGEVFLPPAPNIVVPNADGTNGVVFAGLDLQETLQYGQIPGVGTTMMWTNGKVYYRADADADNDGNYLFFEISNYGQPGGPPLPAPDSLANAPPSSAAGGTGTTGVAP